MARDARPFRIESQRVIGVKEPNTTTSAIRLLGLDVDGTLLERETGVLRPRLRAVIDQARRAGVRVVLCTGRRYRRASAMATSLGLDTPMVCNSGALVKDPSAHATLWRADFSTDTTARLLGLFTEARERPLSFIDHDEEGPDFTIDSDPTGDPAFDDYVGANREHASIEPGWTTAAARAVGRPHFHFCGIGDRRRMDTLERRVHEALDGKVLCFVQRSPRYTGWMCEILREDAGKWSALWHLAESWGIQVHEICAVGDDQNDRPMIAGAGLGVAMPHAPESVKAVANTVLPEGPSTTLADFLLSLIETSRGTDSPYWELR